MVHSRSTSWCLAAVGGLAVALWSGAGLGLGFADSQPAKSGPAGSAAPAGKSPLAVRIDGTGYTQEDISFYAKYLVGEDVKKPADMQKFLPELILDHVAYDEASGSLPELASSPAVRARIRRFLIRIYVEPYVAALRREINPSREDLLKKLPDPRPRYVLAVIVCRSQERLDAAVDALAKGAPFEKVAEQYSEGLSSEKGGQLPPIEEGNYVLFNEDEFQHIRALKEGEVSKPFKTRIGWAVVKMIDFMSPSDVKNAELDRNFESLVEAERSSVISARIGEMRMGATTEIDNAAVQRVKDLLAKGQPLTEAVRSGVLATVNGEPIVGDELEDIRDYHSVESLESFLDRRIRNEVLIGEALKGVDAGELSRRTEMAKKRLVTRMFFRRKADSFGASPQELREFYKANAQQFRTEEVRKLAVIQNADRKKVEEAARLAKKGKNFSELAGRFNDREENRKIRGDVGFARRKDLRPEVRDAVFSAARGAVLGPFEVATGTGETGFVLMKVVEIAKPEVIPFEKLDRDVLTDKVVARKMEDFYRGFLADVYKSHQIEQFN